MLRGMDGSYEKVGTKKYTGAIGNVYKLTITD
jgi:hypothetical protein